MGLKPRDGFYAIIILYQYLQCKMLNFEFKVKPKAKQIQAINEAIRTVQFVRNKTLRYWIDEKENSKATLFRYSTRLRKEFSFVQDLMQQSIY
jgi:transposase